MGIKALISSFFKFASKAKPINDLSDYRLVKKWVKKVIKLYIAFSILAVLISCLVVSIAKHFNHFNMPAFFVYIIVPPMILLTCWGYATMIMYLPQIIKTVFKTGKIGFDIGENIETTHVNVTYEYGNTYKVSSYTENKGCLVAFIVGMLCFMAWAFFCVYIGPFITLKKIHNSLDNLKKYNKNQIHIN